MLIRILNVSVRTAYRKSSEWGCTCNNSTLHVDYPRVMMFSHHIHNGRKRTDTSTTMSHYIQWSAVVAFRSTVWQSQRLFCFLQAARSCYCLTGLQERETARVFGTEETDTVWPEASGAGQEPGLTMDLVTHALRTDTGGSVPSLCRGRRRGDDVLNRRSDKVSIWSFRWHLEQNVFCMLKVNSALY